MVSRRVMFVLAGASAALLAILVAAAWFQVSLTTRRAHQAANVIVTIEPGMGTRAIVSRLQDKGIIADTSALILWLALTGQSDDLKAGDYQFHSPISAIEVIQKIRRGEIATRRVTIPEGKNRFYVAELLAEKTGLASRQKFLQLTADPGPIRDLDPEATSLEGYLFPDTYEYTTKTTAEELVRSMVQRFRDVYKPEWATTVAPRSMSLRRLMTLASMVEAEAQVDEERPVIASVFYNRLDKAMMLESDPTFIYAAILSNDYDGNVNNPKHRQRLSPYNTYQFPGLPPGPIANPGRKSIEAALNPAGTDYLYFVVSDTNGHHRFSRTAAEHEVAVAAYRRLQAQQRQ